MAGQPVQAETAPPENIADTTDDGSRLYAVYCTVEIPLTVGSVEAHFDQSVDFLKANNR